MSAKSAIKVLVPKGDDSGLFKWVAFLTGSKNALKGAEFFVGGGRVRRPRMRAQRVAGIDRAGEGQAGVQGDSVEFTRHQSPVAGADGAVCGSRRSAVWDYSGSSLR
jgi:hypothetical protein